MKKFNFTIKGTKYSTTIKEVEGNVATVEVNGTEYKVEMEQEAKQTKAAPVRKAAASKAAVASTSKVVSVTAPLPGNIFKILVKEGDEVKAGDNLLVMEAMKMENDIIAEKSGVVASVKVSEGDTVLQGAVLVEFK